MSEEDRAPVGISSGFIQLGKDTSTLERAERQQPVNFLLYTSMDLGTEETNCSETMSTNDDAEDYDEQKAISRGISSNNRPKSKALRERISTPAHSRAGCSNGPHGAEQGPEDDNQQTTSSDNSYYLMSTGQFQQDETPSTGELSELASSNCQAPPSYGTATGLASNCAALDANQLHQLHQMRFQQQQTDSTTDNLVPASRYFLNGQQQQHYGIIKGSGTNGAGNANANAFANERNSLFGKTIALTMGQSKQQQQQQQHQYYHQSQSSDEANEASGHNGFRVADPNALLGTPVIVQHEQQQRVHHHFSTDDVHYLIGNGVTDDPLVRIRCIAETVPVRAHLNVPGNTNDLREHPINLGPDNNQAFAASRQTLSQQHQPSVPINHVISARGSLAWQPKTNQYRALAPLPGTSLDGRANTPSVVHTGDAGQSYGSAASTQEPSARVMKAPSPCVASEVTSPSFATATATGSFSAVLNSQQTPANRNGSLQLTGSISASADFVARQNTGPWQLAQVITHNPNHNQGHPNQSTISGSRATLAPIPASSSTSFSSPSKALISSSKTVVLNSAAEEKKTTALTNPTPKLLSLPLAQSRENLPNSASSSSLGRVSGATSRARREQLQQSAHHRKRRRHRSTSGRSMSPAESHEQQLRSEKQVVAGTSGLILRELDNGLTGQKSLSASYSQPAGSLKQRQQAISAHCWLIDSSDDQTYTSAPRSRQQKEQQHLTLAMTKQSLQHEQQLPPPQVSYRDLTNDLCANSLRMERILKKSDTLTIGLDKRPETSSAVQNSALQIQQQTLPLRSHSHFRRPLSSNLPEERDRNRCGQATTHRDGHPPSDPEQASSAVLRLTALLTLISSIVKRPKHLRVSQSSLSVPHAHSTGNKSMQPLNSVSGSLPATGPYNFAVSSSSSTSAYATESGSHQSSNGISALNRVNHLNLHQQHNSSDPPILLSQLRATVSNKAASSAGSSSLFYSTSGLSGFGTQPSSHGYEYCTDQPFDETKFVSDEINDIPNEPEASEELSASGGGTISSGTSKLKSNQQLQPHLLMSDSELISAGSDGGFSGTLGRMDAIDSSRAASTIVPATTTSARCRWHWFSFKSWIKGRACTQEETVPGCETGEAARYKALRTSRSPSLLRNILSLAKADRVFRCRLIASLVVSAILVALICLLISLLYVRSSAYQRNKLSLLIDDTDYDLAWIWPNEQQLPQVTSQPSKKPPEQMSLDSALRSHLQMVERSEHLNQVQLSMVYLTNLQLASDSFIDLTQLSRYLTLANSTNSGITSSGVLQLNEADQEFVSLVLLSNLHWPLVKWKHQNQQSMAGFLSFALSPTPIAGAQTLKNLLSGLLFTDSVPKIPDNLHPNLNQFIRLNSLLKASSLHIISCSYWLSQKHSNVFQLKEDFCNNLIFKYRRTMLTLSRLDQNQRIKLQNQLDMGLELGQPKWSRSLAGFFLDRLTVLDPETMALLTITSADGSFTSSGANQTLVNLLGLDFYHSMINIEHSDVLNRWRSTDSLFELVKLVISSLTEQADGGSKVSDVESESSFMIDFNMDEKRTIEELLYPWTATKLPPFINPVSYDLFLHPNLTTKFISGMVKIEFQLEKPTNFIVIHSSNLNLIELNVWLKQNDPILAPDMHPNSNAALKRLTIRRVLINPTLEQIYIELQEQLDPWTLLHDDPKSAHQNSASFNFANELPLKDTSKRRNQFLISISFNKTSLMLENSEPGLEFITYGDPFALPETELKTMMYTQFEHNNARRIFPSFDEPQLKARFQLNLVHEQHHQVLFNAPKREKVQYTSDGFHQMSVFEQVPVPLSTYLVAFVVCDAQNIKSITSRATQLQLNQPTSIGRPLKHVQVQVLAQFEQLGQAEFASQLVPDLLQFYQSLLQFPYPLEKLDLVAIPRASIINRSTLTDSQQQQLVKRSSNSVDTMENLGLIWFKANLLLADPNIISQDLVERVAMIISHQLAHQFFGNIVSVRSWQDFWFYEAVCHYLESVALSNVQPDWKLDDQFSVTSIIDTLATELTDTNLLAPQQTEHETVETGDRPNSQPLQSSDTISKISASNHFEANILSRKTGIIPSSSAISPSELRRRSAIFHMLLFNLITTDEARARLLRRCLHLYKFTSMSLDQFWHQFNEFLIRSESAGLINSLDLPISHEEKKVASLISFASETSQLDLPYPNQALNSNHTSTSDFGQLNERVVLVRANTFNRRYSDKEDELTINDAHRIQIRARSSIGSKNKLELVANAWFEKSGYPLVTASASRDEIHLRQERFSFDKWPEATDNSGSSETHNVEPRFRARRSNGFSETQDDIWPIPLTMVSRFNPRAARFFWLDKRHLEVSFAELSNRAYYPTSSLNSEDFIQTESKKGAGSAWYKLNVNQSSLVRVNYDERNWEALTELLIKSHYSNHILSALDRANLLDDVFTLLRHGQLSVGLAMNLTLYLEVAERDYMPWATALKHLDKMQILLNQNPLWSRYVLKLIRPISSVIGWKDDGPHLMRKLRRSLFNVALQCEDEKTINKAKQEFKGWYKSGRFVVPNLQELVYIAGVRYGDQQEWFHCWQKYQQLVALDFQNGSTLSPSNHSFLIDSSLHEIRARQILSPGATTVSGSSEPNDSNIEVEKRQLLSALASTRNTWLLEQFLNYSLDPMKIQPYHLKHVLQTLGKNPVARLYLWRFLRFNWITFIDRYINANDAVSFLELKIDFRPYLTTLDPQDNHQVLETLIVESTRHFGSKLDYEDVKNFFELKLKQLQERLNLGIVTWSPTLEKAIQQSLRIVRSNIFWCDHIEPRMIKWLTYFNGAN